MTTDMRYPILQLDELSNDYCGTKSSRHLFATLQELGKIKPALKPMSRIQLSGPLYSEEGQDWEQYFNVNFTITSEEIGILKLRFSELDIFDHAFEDVQVRKSRCLTSTDKLIERLSKFNVIACGVKDFVIPVFQGADSYHFMIGVLNVFCNSELVPMTMAASTSFQSLVQSDDYTNTIATLNLLRSFGEFNSSVFNSNLAIQCNLRVGIQWTPVQVRLVSSGDDEFVLIIEYIEAGMSESHHRKVKKLSYKATHFCEFSYPETLNINLKVKSSRELLSQIGTIVGLLT